MLNFLQILARLFFFFNETRLFVVTSPKILDFSFSVEASSGLGLDLLRASSQYYGVLKSNDFSVPISDSEFMELVKELMELAEDIPFSSSGCWLALDILEYGWPFSSLFPLFIDSGSC